MPLVLNNVQNPSSGLEWNERGDAICVRHPEEFAKNTLPLHFKHSNFASFVRQLHMYGFSKSPPQPSSAHLHEFRHRHLLRDDLSLARLIRRKVNAPPMSELQLLSQQVRLRHSRTVTMRTFWFDLFFLRCAGTGPCGASSWDGTQVAPGCGASSWDGTQVATGSTTECNVVAGDGSDSPP